MTVLVKEIDNERMAVAAAYGVSVLSAEEWLVESYDTHGEDLYHLIQNNAAYSTIKAPKTIDARYITEDVPMSLCQSPSWGVKRALPRPISTLLSS